MKNKWLWIIVGIVVIWIFIVRENRMSCFDKENAIFQSNQDRITNDPTLSQNRGPGSDWQQQMDENSRNLDIGMNLCVTDNPYLPF